MKIIVPNCEIVRQWWKIKWLNSMIYALSDVVDEVSAIFSLCLTFSHAPTMKSIENHDCLFFRSIYDNNVHSDDTTFLALGKSSTQNTKPRAHVWRRQMMSTMPSEKCWQNDFRHRKKGRKTVLLLVFFLVARHFSTKRVSTRARTITWGEIVVYRFTASIKHVDAVA